MAEEQTPQDNRSLRIEGGFFALACAASCVGGAYADELVLSGPLLGLAALFACGSAVAMFKLRGVNNRTGHILSWVMIILAIMVMIGSAVAHFSVGT